MGWVVVSTRPLLDYPDPASYDPMTEYAVKRGTRVLWLAWAALLSALAPSAARADPVADAKDLFARGRDLRGQGDCASAIPLFRKAFELFPAGLGSLRNTAECEESMGHFASSRRAWLDLKRALITVDDRKYDGWSHDAEAAAARLAPKLATLTFDITAVGAGGVSAPVDGVEVRLNGEVLSPGLLGTPLERDPGRYVVSAGGPRVKAPQEKAVQIGAGEAKKVALQVEVTGGVQGAGAEGTTSTPTPTPTEPPPESDEDHRAATRRTLAWVAFGVGAAGVIGTVGSALVRSSAFSDLRNEECNPDNDKWDCAPGANKSAVQSTLDKGNTASTLVNVFLPLAIVGAGTGVVLLATSHPRSAGAALVMSPTGAWAVGRF